jgi:hypothetical protein
VVYAKEGGYTGVMCNAALTWLTENYKKYINAQGGFMQILTWNLEFWRRISSDHFTLDDIRNWKKFVYNLIHIDFDFILLQEINPYFILGKKYINKNGPVEYLNVGDKNIYYHELLDTLICEKYRANDIFWGTAIIAHKKYKLLNEYSIGSKYFGCEALMCYDFGFDNKRITIINYYKKGIAYEKDMDKKYYYDERFFCDIQEIVNMIKNKNMIIFGGDFNTDYSTLKRIEEIGFVEKTKHIENTMTDGEYKQYSGHIKKVYPGHNDCIFVNKEYANLVDHNNVKKVPTKESISVTKDKELNEFVYKNYSDHYGIRCSII